MLNLWDPQTAFYELMMNKNAQSDEATRSLATQKCAWAACIQDNTGNAPIFTIVSNRFVRDHFCHDDRKILCASIYKINMYIATMKNVFLYLQDSPSSNCQSANTPSSFLKSSLHNVN